MGRTTTAVICVLAALVTGCGDPAAEAEIPPLFETGQASADAEPALIGYGSRAAPEAAERAEPRAPEPPRASVGAEGQIEIPDEALWSSVRDALEQAASRHRPLGLARDAAVEVELPGEAGTVIVVGTRPTGAAWLRVRIRGDEGRSTEVRARGAAWPVELGCEFKTTWHAEGWSLEPLQNGLAALREVGEPDERFVEVRPDAGVPAAVVFQYLALAREAGDGPPVINTARHLRRQDLVDGSGAWLKVHQASTGAWDGDVSTGICNGQPVRHEPVRGDPAKAENAGLTGLSLCAFLGAGYTNRGKHPYKITVSRGLRHLKNIQRKDGRFPAAAGWDVSVAHASAALAMLEAYGMTGSPIFKGPAIRALSALESAYAESREDALSTALTAMALKSALLINEDAVRRSKDAPLHVDEAFRERLLRYAERQRSDRGDLDAACWLITRVLLDDAAYKADDVKAGALSVAKTLLKTGDRCDPAHFWLGTVVTFRAGRKPWKVMKRALETHVIESQSKEGHVCCKRGSWDAFPDAAIPGGRVAATALFALCLEVYYRYDRVFGVR
ncbi:MAG: hypothetical protein QNJ98_16255 [Planctomycetota bacterium]|nr:hypothetical protein [Planctomycetota bacterium]